MFLHVFALLILPNRYNLTPQSLFLKIPQTQNSKLKTQNCRARAMLSASKNQSNAQGGKSKNPFFQFFFNCLYCNNLIPSILPKITPFSHQMRKFALLRGTSFLSAEALAKADFEMQTTYGNNYRISTNFRSPRSA